MRESFGAQQFMATIGARLVRLEPGTVDVELDFSERLTQQHGFLHAGVVSAALDTACGYAALTSMESDAAVLTVEFKVNLLEPAAGGPLVARGRVLRAGRTLTVCRGEAVIEERHVATVVATMMAVRAPGLAPR